MEKKVKFSISRDLSIEIRNNTKKQELFEKYYYPLFFLFSK